MQKLQDEAQEDELREALIDKIEAMVDEGRLTRKKADDYYAWYSSIHPKLRYAMSKFRNISVKEKILIEQEARDRDEAGKVIPLPIPEPKTAKEVVEAKKRTKQTIAR